MKCPRCKKEKVSEHWDRVGFCDSCHLCFSITDRRFYFCCPTDRTELVPRATYRNATLVCPECKKEYKIPDEPVPSVVQADLE